MNLGECVRPHHRDFRRCVCWKGSADTWLQLFAALGGGSYRNLSLAGFYFGSFIGSITVTVGANDCPVLSLEKLLGVVISTEQVYVATCQVVDESHP